MPAYPASFDLLTEAGECATHAQSLLSKTHAFVYLHVGKQCVMLRTEDQLHSAIAVLTGIRAKIAAARDTKQIVAQSDADVDAMWANIRAGRPDESQIDGLTNELAEAA